MHDFLQFLCSESVGLEDVSRGIGDSEGNGPKLQKFLNRVLGHIPRPTDDAPSSLDGHLVVLTPVLGKVDGTVARSLRANQTSSPSRILPREDSLELTRETLVLSEEETNLPTTHSDISGWDITIMPNVTVQARHEALQGENNEEKKGIKVHFPETDQISSGKNGKMNRMITYGAKGHDLIVWLALGVKVRASLATTHWETSEGILEDLLKSKEFDHPEIDCGMEAESTLVWAKGRGELDTVSAVHALDALVIHPGHTESNDTLRLSNRLHDGQVTLILLKNGLEREEDFFKSLEEFRLVGITGLDLLEESLHLLLHAPFRLPLESTPLWHFDSRKTKSIINQIKWILLLWERN